MFLKDADNKNIPMDGMPIFVQKSWETIKDQKQLNLPDARMLVADYRCNEFKDEALEVVNP